MEHAEAVLRLDDAERIDAGIAHALGPRGAPAQPHFVLDAHVAVDADLLPWADATATSRVGRAWLRHLIHHPCTDAAILTARAGARAPARVMAADAREAALLWALTLPDLKSTWPMPFLFPTWPVLRSANHIPFFLEVFHAYRLWIAPTCQIAYPILLVLGPWLFIRIKLKWHMDFGAYIKIVMKLVKTGAGMSWTTLLTVAMYVGLYIYSVAQTVDIARMVYKWRKVLMARLRAVHGFYEATRKAVDLIPDAVDVARAYGMEGLAPLPPLGVSTTIQGVYQLWTAGTPMRARLADALRWHALIDVIHVKEMALSHGVKVDWVDAARAPRMWGMKHPALASSRGNPLSLERNLIVTGPNAAGKTTYLRATLANILLAQSLGVAFASRAELAPHIGMGTFMRVADETGKASLFEAEVQRCLSMWQSVADHPPGPFLLVLDEPMHATPPLEGAAAAMAFLRMVAAIPGVRVMVTTHYHEVTGLAQLNGDAFANISMEAVVAPAGPITFSYRLRAGPSFQCIALELMRDREFPRAFVEDAIEMKNKICRERVRAQSHGRHR